MDNLDKKVFELFSGRVVPKGATKKIKNSANVPTYVLEYLLGTYCTSDDAEEIEQGIEQVKRILADNYVRPDEAEKIKAKIKENHNYTVIDKLSVKLNERSDNYMAEFMFLGINNVYVHPKYVRDYEKLLAGGIWCIVDLTYFFDEDEKGKSPFMINDITPIQMPNLDKNEIIERAMKIGTYETSILPYEDCCTVFLPKHPLIRPDLAKVEKAESALDVEGLLAEALSGEEILRL